MRPTDATPIHEVDSGFGLVSWIVASPAKVSIVTAMHTARPEGFTPAGVLTNDQPGPRVRAGNSPVSYFPVKGMAGESRHTVRTGRIREGSFMPEKPQVRDAELTRSRLLGCAEQLFVKKGYHDVGVDEVAAAAGVNKRMIYVYFGSKRGLYDAVLDSIFNKLNDLDLKGVNVIPDYVDRVVALLRMYFVFLSENQNFVRLLQWENLYADKGSIKQLVGRAYRILDYMVGVLEEGVANGSFKPGLDVRYAAFQVNAAFISFFGYRLISREVWDLDFASEKVQSEVFNHIVDVVLNGVLAGTGPDRVRMAPAGQLPQG